MMLGKRIFYLIFPVLIAACATPTRELSQDELEEAFDGGALTVAERKSLQRPRGRRGRAEDQRDPVAAGRVVDRQVAAVVAL